jgi:hypothetical protein
VDPNLRLEVRRDEFARGALGRERQIRLGGERDADAAEVESEAGRRHEPNDMQPPRAVQSPWAGPETPMVLQLPSTASSGRRATSDKAGFS